MILWILGIVAVIWIFGALGRAGHMDNVNRR